MLVKTNTLTAPWTVVEGNCKWYSRVKVLKTLVNSLSKELDYDPFTEHAFPGKDPHKKSKSMPKSGKKSRKGKKGKKD